MENASKALLMAAGVLIGILILSLAVYLFATFGATSSELHKQNDANKINQFNTQFTSYEGKNSITIYDVISVANLATENNIYYELRTPDKSNYYVQVFYNGQSIEKGFEDTKNIDYNKIIAEETGNYNPLRVFTCKTYISDTTQRVYRVDFTKTN